MKQAVSAILILMTLCSPLSAQTRSAATNVSILYLQLNKDYPNLVFIKVSSAPTGKPACSNNAWDYTLPLASALDDKMYAALLAAYAAKSTIDIGGLGGCSEYPNIESLGYVHLKN